ncbi:MAG: 16S rRNA (cytosine(1402)-N(4))-methyltransferase RsmH [Planctomycetota bacterium]
MTFPSVHVPVLVEQILAGLKLHEERDSDATRVFIDGTLGGAGHAMRIASCLTNRDTLVALDRDPSVIQRMLPFLESHLDTRAERSEVGWFLNPSRGCRWVLCADSYCEAPSVLSRLGVAEAHGILLDLGLSSDQLQDTERGFSFRIEGPLDLRFDSSTGFSAADFLRVKSEKEIADTIYRFGEERFSRRIARAIVEKRQTQPIENAKQLADLIHRVVPGRIHGRVDSATRTFQALRIAVNQELEHVEQAMRSLPQCLAEGGRLAVISFHSLEDRIVKHALREHPLLKVITKKPILADTEEVDANPRSRSAKLRIAERTEA